MAAWSTPNASSARVDPGVVRHPVTVRREQEHQATVRELGEKPLCARRCHRGATLAAAGARGCDVRCAVRDHTARSRVVVAPNALEKRVGTPAAVAADPRPCATMNGPSTIESASMSKTYPRGCVLGRPSSTKYRYGFRTLSGCAALNAK